MVGKGLPGIPGIPGISEPLKPNKEIVTWFDFVIIFAFLFFFTVYFYRKEIRKKGCEIRYACLVYFYGETKTEKIILYYYSCMRLRIFLFICYIIWLIVFWTVFWTVVFTY